MLVLVTEDTAKPVRTTAIFWEQESRLIVSSAYWPSNLKPRCNQAMTSGKVKAIFKPVPHCFLVENCLNPEVKNIFITYLSPITWSVEVHDIKSS